MMNVVNVVDGDDIDEIFSFPQHPIHLDTDSEQGRMNRRMTRMLGMGQEKYGTINKKERIRSYGCMWRLVGARRPPRLPISANMAHQGSKLNLPHSKLCNPFGSIR